ncbi:5-formyltetrahydrofolate cyclo-ligase [Pseudanabaena sp. FACHB-2040]|uniref:5-formyltetrahydrofolate cyclo-ligase n=1 Tax=Pseudanabaena sp. FACHB-2040 TaxID=2692859 RepID=UPI001687EDEE|nr:5-formyltetrahydrofolate cyclo-ligase [Pseudanabaena sp. FACHB-2040]MBD2256126.1 5-formyltetrahydrofolate cyclo-ligase [Pseudanabaena sp. FACHB-2040]
MSPSFKDNLTQNLPASEWSGRHTAKDALRTQVWATLKAQKAVRRDPFGHIPDFLGADLAAQRLAALPAWQQAQVIKCNPDSPQKPVRLQALQDGKTLYMAVPRLTRQQCFVELKAAALAAQGISLETAATLRNALIYGRPISFDEMEPINLVVVGCVAVNPDGGRTGKGAGFADLELGMMAQFGLVKPQTPIVTTVHSLQVIASDPLPMQPHDWPLDWIATPDAVIATQTRYARPQGLDWHSIQPEQYQKIPILRSLRPASDSAES